jgi:hypothetical protein
MTAHSWVAKDNVALIKKWQCMWSDEILLHLLNQTEFKMFSFKATFAAVSFCYKYQCKRKEILLYTLN